MTLEELSRVSQANNNTGLHSGQGLLLPIDAHFQTLYRFDGIRWRNRIQTYDSTFTLAPTNGIPNIHHAGLLSPVPSLPAVKVFDDRILHYDPTTPPGQRNAPEHRHTDPHPEHQRPGRIHAN